jgi:hypothetical protein
MSSYNHNCDQHNSDDGVANVAAGLVPVCEQFDEQQSNQGDESCVPALIHPTTHRRSPLSSPMVAVRRRRTTSDEVRDELYD